MAIVYLAEPGGQPTSYNEPQAEALWQQGRLSPNTLFWKDGMTEWRPVGEVLAHLTPLPPAPAPMTVPVPDSTPPAPVPFPASYAAPSVQLVRDPRTLTKVVVGLMWLSLVLSAVAVCFSGVALATGSASTPPGDELTTRDLFQVGVGLSQTLVFIATTIPFLMWVHLANRNARALGARGMQFTPGWAVGWYFVPLFNLWKPYQAMKEIWQASHNPASWGNEPVASPVRIWWGFWLLTNFLGQISFRLAFRAETPTAYFSTEVVSLLSDLSNIALCLVAMRLLDCICRRQIAWVEP